LTDFSRAQLDDAPAAHPSQVRRDGPGRPRVVLYGSTVDAIRAAAFELVVEHQLTLELAWAALPKAIEWVAQQADGAPPTDGGRGGDAT
jgi:hypothetical protein